MKAESNLMPQSAFVAERRGDFVDVTFFSNVISEVEEEKEIWRYDSYSLTVPYRPDIEMVIAENYNAWLEMAIANEEIPAPPETDTDKITRLETEQARLQEIVDTMLGGIL